MRTDQFRRWVLQCVADVRKYGIQEKDNFADEVIFSMEESAERRLTPTEQSDAMKILNEVQ